MSYQLVNTAAFEDCIDAYRSNASASAALGQTMVELMSKPFGNPRLQTHRVKRAQGRTFTSYVDNKGHRLIWRLVDKAIILLLFGEHDATYRRAENLRLETDPQTGLPEVRDVDPVDLQSRPYRQQRQRVGRLFMAWRDDELADVGLEEHEVLVIRGLDTEAELMALEGDMRPDAHEAAVTVLLYGIDGDVAGSDDVEDPEPAVDDGLPDAEELELARALDRPGASGEFVPVEPEFMLEILERPIEDWMIFLHPDQAALVERTFSGPARIRGASGTGKTVVGLHRAARAARRGERVLFTTFISSLPPVLESLFARLAPDVAGRVEFAHLHGWARELLDVNGDGPTLDEKLIANAWSNAWRRVEDRGLKKLGSAYVQEEVGAVIRARGLSTLGDYLELDRVGRRRPLTERQRRGVWEVAEHYRTALRRLGTIDHAEVLVQALHLVSTEGPRYDVVIVDEAQDLDAVGVRLAAALCGADDGGQLLLVGDGQQSVYPGAWTFAEVGLEVRGRSAVLRTNYRNTAEILDVAMGVVQQLDFDEGEATREPGSREVHVLRSGEQPVRRCFPDGASHDAALLERIGELVSRPMVGPGDLLVAVPDNHMVGEIRSMLGEEGIETMDLRSYHGQVDDRVKVGTYLRAKGLEFKHVLVPRLDRLAARMDEDQPDRSEVAVRQLFVALGRARDGLWLGAVVDGDDPLAAVVEALGDLT